MNARERGEEVGKICMMAYVGVSRESFEKVALHQAKHAYVRQEKQAEFMEGFMSRYVAPHAKDCQCDECKEILTF